MVSPSCHLSDCGHGRAQAFLGVLTALAQGLGPSGSGTIIERMPVARPQKAPDVEVETYASCQTPDRLVATMLSHHMGSPRSLGRELPPRKLRTPRQKELAANGAAELANALQARAAKLDRLARGPLPAAVSQL